MTIQRRTRALWALPVLLPCLPACSPGERVEIDTRREAPPEVRFAQPNASSEMRFGGGSSGSMGGGAAKAPAESPFEWETPPGWEELAPKQFRDINLRPAGDPELECYVTILQGTGGGLAANVNRWRGQFGLDPMQEVEVADLPDSMLLGMPAKVVELRDESDPPRMLMGRIFLSQSFLVTVKMTGPESKVEAQRAGFDLFCNTLAVKEQAGGSGSTAQGGAEDHTGHDHGPNFEAPEGWVDAGASSMRLINLRTPGGSECYVIRLGGEAGGLAANLNRWRGEVGMDPIGDAEIAVMPTVKLLGKEVPLLEVSGTYSGMGGQSGPGKAVLGVALIRSDASLFVKMVGDEADIAEQKANFIELLGSIQGL